MVKLTYDQMVDKMFNLRYVFPELSEDEIRGMILERYEAPDEGRWASEREWAQYQETINEDYFDSQGWDGY